MCLAWRVHLGDATWDENMFSYNMFPPGMGNNKKGTPKQKAKAKSPAGSPLKKHFGRQIDKTAVDKGKQSSSSSSSSTAPPPPPPGRFLQHHSYPTYSQL